MPSVRPMSLNTPSLASVAVLCTLIVGACSDLQLPDDRASLLILGDSPDLETSVRASQKLAELYGESALLEALQTSGPTGRGWAAALLLGYPSAPVREALLLATQDSSADVRAKVAITLGGICDRQCLPALEALASDTDEKVRESAERSKLRIVSQPK